MGSLICLIIVLFSAGFYFSEKRSDRRRITERDARLKRRDETWDTLVCREKHGDVLNWLNDPKNFAEIQQHVRNVLKQIWGRDVEYTVHGDAVVDIRKVIYFAEHGFLPSLYADKMRVSYRVGNMGFSRNMTDIEFWSLKEWVWGVFKEKGVHIGLTGTGRMEQWQYVSRVY